MFERGLQSHAYYPIHTSTSSENAFTYLPSPTPLNRLCRQNNQHTGYTPIPDHEEHYDWLAPTSARQSEAAALGGGVPAERTPSVTQRVPFATAVMVRS